MVTKKKRSRNPDVDFVSGELAFLLRHHKKNGGRPKTRMTINSTSLLTEDEFEGVPLRRILAPKTPDDPIQAEQYLDVYLYPLRTGEGGTPLRELKEEGGVEIRAFVERAGTVQEQVSRLLYALGSHPDAQLEYGENRMVVTHGSRTFGFENGEVFSRFSNGFHIGDFDPRPMLEKSFPTLVYDQSFGSLYREAYRRELDHVLVALHTGQPSFPWRNLARNASPEMHPSGKNFKAWEHAVFNGRDPTAALYKHLVPVWLTRGKFCEIFGSITRRQTDPPLPVRQTMLNKLYIQFHKKNKRKSK